MHYILSDKIEKSKIWASISGILQNEQEEIIPSSFGHGEALKTNEKYIIKKDPKWSKPGEKSDRLIVKAHSNNLLVVNQKVKSFLEEAASSDVEFRPVFFTPENISGYFIVNVLSKIDCVDYENSELDFEEYDDDDEGHGDIYTIDSLAIDSNKIPNNKNIFLLDRRQDAIIIVSEKLKSAIEKNLFTGFEFVDPQNFCI